MKCRLKGCRSEAKYPRRELCGKHYQRLARQGLLELFPLRPVIKVIDICKISACDRIAVAREMCHKHYKYHYCRKVSPSRPRFDCDVDNCDAPAYSEPSVSGYHFCRRHRHRRLTEDLRETQIWKNKSCSFDGCPNMARSGKLCPAHYSQHRKGQPLVPLRVPKGFYVNGDGYVLLNVNGKWIQEHRVVMAGIIGRDLYPDETVHHKNGRRHDNRRANLELWVSKHPSGQRIEDMIDYCVEMLERYDASRLA